MTQQTTAPFSLSRPDLEILIEKLCGDFDTAPAVTRLLARLVRFRITLEDREHEARSAANRADPGFANPARGGLVDFPTESTGDHTPGEREQ